MNRAGSEVPCFSSVNHLPDYALLYRVYGEWHMAAASAQISCNKPGSPRPPAPAHSGSSGAPQIKPFCRVQATSHSWPSKLTGKRCGFALSVYEQSFPQHTANSTSLWCLSQWLEGRTLVLGVFPHTGFSRCFNWYFTQKLNASSS